MKYLLLLALTLCALAAEAQKEQFCKVREQNSKRKPLPNVQVIFEDAPAAVSQSDGTVRLLFQTRKAGEWTFKLDINRTGYELVNEKEVEKVKLSADNEFGVDIILARAGVVDSLKGIYYGVSNTSLKKGFEREKAKLRQESDAARLNAEQYAEQLEQFNKTFEEQRKNLDALSEKFARVNFDDVDSIYQQALELFKAGEVNKAINVLEAIDPAKRTEAIIKKGVFLDSLYVVYQKEKRQQIASLRLLADMYSATFDPKKAESQYDQLLRLDSTDLEILWDAAEFYRNNHRYDKALRTYPLVIAHPKAENWRVGNAHENIGKIYATTGNLSDALSAYNESLEIYIESSHNDPENSFYKRKLVHICGIIGMTYRDQDSLSFALRYFERGNDLAVALHEAYPQDINIKNELADAVGRLGIGNQDLYYWNHKRELITRSIGLGIGNRDFYLNYLTRALTYFGEYKRLKKQLHEAYPQNMDFENGLAISYAKLGETYAALGNLPQALTCFEECNRLKRQLHEAYMQNMDFKYGLAFSYNQLGWLQSALENLPQALIFFEKGTNLSKELYEAYPQNINFKRILTTSYSDLGETNRALGNLSKALTFFEEYNRLVKELHNTYPQNVDFKNDLANSYSQLGETHTALGNLEKASIYLKQYEELSSNSLMLLNLKRINTHMLIPLPFSFWRKPDLSPIFAYDSLKRYGIDISPFLSLQNLEEHHLKSEYGVLSGILELKRAMHQIPSPSSKIDFQTKLCDSLRLRIAQYPTQKPALAEALNSRARTGFFMKKFAAVEADVREGLSLETENKFLPSNLAPALLLQGKQKEAMREYKKWKDKPFGEQNYPTYREAFLDDLNTFEKAGIIPPEILPRVQKVRKLLEE